MPALAPPPFEVAFLDPFGGIAPTWKLWLLKAQTNIAGALTVAGGFAVTLTATAATNVQLPPSGILLAAPYANAPTNHAVMLGQGTYILGVTSVGATNTLLHGNTGADPTYSAVVNADITNATIDLTTKVTGLLPPANGGTGAGAFTLGSVPYVGASGVYAQDNPNWFWDATNKRLGLKTAAAPATTLDVNGQGTFRDALQVRSFTSPFNIVGGFSWTGTDNGQFFLNSANVSKVNILGSGNSYFNGGNVGINKTVPTTRLDAIGGVGDSVVIRGALGTVGGAIGVTEQLVTDNTSGLVGDWSGIGFTYNEASPHAFIGSILTSVAGTSLADLVFAVRASTAVTVVTEYMRLQGGGNVGIGTSNPGALLDLGLAGTKLGVLRVAGSTSGNVTIQPAAIAGTWTLTLPITGGTNKYPLTTDGTGISSWSQLDLTAGVTGLLPVGNGGTGAGAFTAGSVVFAGAAGVYTQKNANFFWDNTNFRLGLGTTNPGTVLTTVGTTVGGAIGTAFQQEIVNVSQTVGDWVGTIYRGSAPNNANNNMAYIGTIVTSTAVNGLADLTFGVKASTGVVAITEYMRLQGGGNVGIGTTNPTTLFSVSEKFNVTTGGLVTKYNNITTAGWGHPTIYGTPDNRTGLTVADGAPITIYTTIASNNIFRVSADIFATAAVTGTATYTIAWTENATAQAMAVTATAINVLGTASNLIRPDIGTVITAQLTGVFTGTFTVAGFTEQLA